jgi:hypothetical protein
MRTVALVALFALMPTSRAGDAHGGLVGSWRLVSGEDRPARGPSIFPYGAEPKGLLIYDATGHMAIQLMKQSHPKVASGDEDRATLEEKAALPDPLASSWSFLQDSCRRVEGSRELADGDAAASWCSMPKQPQTGESGRRHSLHLPDEMPRPAVAVV